MGGCGCVFVCVSVGEYLCVFPLTDLNVFWFFSAFLSVFLSDCRFSQSKFSNGVYLIISLIKT